MDENQIEKIFASIFLEVDKFSILEDLFIFEKETEFEPFGSQKLHFIFVPNRQNQARLLGLFISYYLKKHDFKENVFQVKYQAV